VNESESRRLVEDGVISFEQAEGISGERHRLPDWAGPRTIEWLGYFGAAALFFATVVLVGDLVDAGNIDILDILGGLNNVAGGIAALVGGALLLAIGWRFAKSTDGAARRSAGFMLLAGYGLAALASWLLLLDLDLGDFTPVVNVIPIIVVAVFVWRTAPSLPTQLALFSMVTQVVSSFLVLVQVTERTDLQSMVVGVALGGTPDVGRGWVPTMVAFAVGLLWIAMGSAGTLRPRNAAFVIGSLYAWVAAIELFASGDGWIVVSVLFTGLLVWMAVSRRSSVLGAIGAVSTFGLIGQVMSLFVDSPGTTTLELWFGIPGAAALGGALMLLMRSGGASTKATTPAPAPAATSGEG